MLFFLLQGDKEKAKEEWNLLWFVLNDDVLYYTTKKKVKTLWKNRTQMCCQLIYFLLCIKQKKMLGAIDLLVSNVQALEAEEMVEEPLFQQFIKQQADVGNSYTKEEFFMFLVIKIYCQT